MSPSAKRLLGLVAELRARGDEDLAMWIARHLAEEEREERRWRGAKRRRKVKVQVVGAGGTSSSAWIEADRLTESEEAR